MYKEALGAIEGVEVFPIISMLIFVAFFTSLLVWFFRADKEELGRAARLPLDQEADVTAAGGAS